MEYNSQDTTMEYNFQDSDMEQDEDTYTHQITSTYDQPISQSNIGSKTLKRLGWNGGGLGRKRNGIQEPIKEHHRIYRSGLGSDKESISPWSYEIQFVRGEITKSTIIPGSTFDISKAIKWFEKIHNILKPSQQDEEHEIQARRFYEEYHDVITNILERRPLEKVYKLWNKGLSNAPFSKVLYAMAYKYKYLRVRRGYILQWY